MKGEGKETILEKAAVRAVFLWGGERRGSVSVTPCSLRRDERGDISRMRVGWAEENSEILAMLI